MWPRAKSASRVGLNSFLWGWAAPQPPTGNAGGAQTAEQLGARAFWPTTLDKECDKAARILRSFCKDGFYEAAEDDPDDELEGYSAEPPPDDLAVNGEDVSISSAASSSEPSTATAPPALPPRPRPAPRARGRLRRIPVEVVRTAKGLAIFTTMRAGLWVAGAGGSGVVVARQPDGSWTAPSAILLRTEGAAASFSGAGVYDVVVVLNTADAVAAFLQARFALGGATLVTVPGPLDGELVTPDTLAAPAFAYVKARGVRARVPLTGTVVEQRRDENARFYGARVAAAADVLLGVRASAAPPAETEPLRATLKAAQGDTDVDPALIPVDAAPSDCDIADGHVFGVPDRADPDPYGFLALEREGLAVREAGTRRKASRDSFHFAPAPSSPLFGAFRRDGDDPPSGHSRHSSWRASILSTGTMTDTATQTTDHDGQSDSGPPPLPSRPGSAAAVVRASMSSIPEVAQPADPASIAARLSAPTTAKPTAQPPPLPARPTSTITPPMTPTGPAAAHSPVSPLSAGSEADDEDDGSDDDDDDGYGGYGDDDCPVEIVALPVARAASAAPATVMHPRLVTVVKPPPPALPPRNPVRARRAAPPGTLAAVATAAAAAAAPAPANSGPTSAPSLPLPPTSAPALSQPGLAAPTAMLPPVWTDDVNDVALLGGQGSRRQRAESASSSVYSAQGRGGQTTGVVDAAGREQANAPAPSNTPGLAI
jgi:lipid-binding SYLF domain-containing protein